jgi:DNA-binding transcriptional LysR family regulator
MRWMERIGRRLKPRDLHVFLAVAEQGNMAKAAERLAISRPVVSKTIAGLEHTLGVRLLDRTPKGVEPTLYGRALLKRSIVVFDELRESVEEIRFLADPNAGELRVGCTEVMAAGLVSAVIDRLSRRYPRLRFQLELGNASTLQFNSLRERKCELVIARQLATTREPDIDAEVLFYEQLLVAAGPRNKWHGRRKMTLAHLADEPWILTQLESESGSPVVEAFRTSGLDVPRASILSDSLNLRNSLLATGRYVTMIPGSVLRFGPQRTLLNVLPIEIPRWRLPISIMTLRNRTLSPVAQLFIQCTREVAKPLATGR